MNMVDHLTGPMAGVSSRAGESLSKMERLNQSFGGMAKTGMVMAGVGAQITDATLAPVKATFETRKAIGELASLGVQDLGRIESAAKNFSDQWAGTTKAEFISAAYDIKSGISSLSDEGVADMTSLSALTAKATKSTAAEMTSLFATGYGIYKDYYNDLSDLEFGQMFSAGISQSVKQFKTTGSGMAQGIQTLGASATNANVPLEEQLSILGMLQATMGGSEAGTKYKAFLRSAVKGGKELGLSFTDANNQLLSLPEILDLLRGKFGETMDAAEKVKLQQAFGDTEAVALIDLMYNKVGDLNGNIAGMYQALGSGTSVTKEMASAMQNMEPDQWQRLEQRIHNVSEQIGNTMLPTINLLMDRIEESVEKISTWIDKHQLLVQIIMIVVLAIGGFLTVVGTTTAVIGGVGLAFTKTVGFARGFSKVIKGIPGTLETIQIYGMLAGDGIKRGFSTMRSAGTAAIGNIKRVALSIANMARTAAISGATALKNMALGLVAMARQAITTAITAMPGLIASVWSFTAALFANPITWIVIGIVALIAALVLLWQNWDSVVSWIQGAWDGFVNGIKAGFDWISNLFNGMPAWLQIVFAVFMPFIGIPLLIKNNWGSIVSFFSNLWTGVKTTFTNGIQGIKTFISGTFTWFRESGAKILTTFTEGIKSTISAPVDAVKSGLAKIRQMLPFSDAKEGPLSTLTLSGKRTMTTYAEGLTLAQESPVRAVENGLRKTKIALDREPIKKVQFESNGRTESSDSDENKKGNSGKTVTIQKLLMSVELKQIKEIRQLLALVAEIEDETNGNDGYVSGIVDYA
jgi:TP901 family phage tail tape measure protein